MNTLWKLFLLAWKQTIRHPLRTGLTLSGIVSGVFIFSAVEIMQRSLEEATTTSDEDRILVVYRENRFCPSTSQLPEDYSREIERISGVEEVVPIKIAVNNCGATLDVITFRGVPPESLGQYNPELKVIAGSYEEWLNRTDGALVGKTLAGRRGLKPGDRFEAVGVVVHVAAIVESPLPQENNLAYVHLPFLQQSSSSGLGIVTQFNVKAAPGVSLENIAGQIDDRFRTDRAPTSTMPEKAFFASTAKDMLSMLDFTRWLALGATLAVMALVGNALMLVARGRTKENAIFQVVGFKPSLLAGIVLLEGGILGLLGGLLGCSAAIAFFSVSPVIMGNEGLTLAFTPSLPATLLSLAVAIGTSVVASFIPAWHTSRQPLISSLNNRIA